jgi:alkyl sulfatase BDS1-like metallo-beta-lactamase superfamily hydrolase
VSTSADLLNALSVEQLFDSVAVRVDGPAAWAEHLRIAWRVSDEDTTRVMELRNGALHHRTASEVPDGTTTFTLTRLSLIGLVTGTLDLGDAMSDGSVTVEGDPGVLGRLAAVLAPVDPDFDIVVP